MPLTAKIVSFVCVVLLFSPGIESSEAQWTGGPVLIGGGLFTHTLEDLGDAQNHDPYLWLQPL